MEYLILILWFIVAMFALIVEIQTTELVSIWFVIGAFVTMIVSAIIPTNYLAQSLTFVISSIIALIILRPILTKKLKINKKSDTDTINTMDGYKGFAETDIDSQGGKVNVNGTTWSAVSSELIKEGERIKVVKEDNITLVVEKENKEDI